MGKKGSWISSLKKFFTPHSKEKYVHGYETKETTKGKKKWGAGRLRHGDTNSFIPLHRGPSSVEKILGDAERELQIARGLPSREQYQYTSPSLPTREDHATHELPSSAEGRTTEALVPTKYSDQPKAFDYASRVSTASNRFHFAAIRIQTVYRGYMARRSYRALKGLVRLQGVMRGQSVKRQSMSAMRQMQQLVRVQSQIHSRRMQMMESQASLRQHLHKSDKELQETSLSRWSLTPLSEKDHRGDWDDSVLTKEEIDARLQRKVEAVMKRERQLAYAYSHQPKATPGATHSALMDIRSGGFPWLWHWVERLDPTGATDARPTNATEAHSPFKPNNRPNTPIRSSPYNQPKFENHETATPRSMKSFSAARPNVLKQIKPRAGGAEFSPRTPLRDDESLMSCPPLSIPNYMAPTLSAKAKARANGIAMERSVAGSPRGEPKKRMSFGLGQSIGSIKWSKGSLFSNKETKSSRHGGAPKTLDSIGNLSVDSTLSLPAGVGRKPFRFK